jgi:hypothetical protein
MVDWILATPEQARDRITRLGGQPSWTGTPRWPQWNDEAIPFLGQFAVGERLVLVFCSPEPDAEAWKAEGGGNAALVEPDGPTPPWVSTREQAEGPVMLPNLALLPAEPLELGAAPDWLQNDDTPEAATRFILELDSFPDPDGWITFGDGGTAFLFSSQDGDVARFLWQS